jgi:hypothetical protein
MEWFYEGLYHILHPFPLAFAKIREITNFPSNKLAQTSHFVGGKKRVDIFIQTDFQSSPYIYLCFISATKIYQCI